MLRFRWASLQASHPLGRLRRTVTDRRGRCRGRNPGDGCPGSASCRGCGEEPATDVFEYIAEAEDGALVVEALQRHRRDASIIQGLLVVRRDIERTQSVVVRAPEHNHSTGDVIDEGAVAQ